MKAKTIKLFGIIMILVMGMSFTACSSDDDDMPNDPTESNGNDKDYQLEDNVIQLDENTLKHINSVKDMTIIYDANTSKEELPKVGEIILVSKPNSIFPHGFIGKTIAVNEQGGQYHIETESVAIDEVFTYLNVSKSYELIPDEATSTVISRGSETDYITFKKPISKEISSGISVNGELTLGVKIDVTLNIDKRNGKNIRMGNIKTSILQQVDASLDIELEKEYEGNVNLTPKGIIFPILQLGPITLVPALQPYLFVKAEGKIEAHPSMNYQQIRNTSLVFDGQSWKFNQDNASEPYIELNLTPDINLEGSLYDGIGMAMEFRLYGSESNKLFIDSRLGPNISGKATLNPNPDLTYESGKDSQLDFCMLLSAGGGVGMKFFSIEKEWSNYPINISFLKSTRNIFPSFNNNTTIKTNGKISASTELGRDLLCASEVGLALYNGDECVHISEPVVYQFEEKFKDKNPLQVSFGNIPNESNYSIWSYVKWGNTYIKCKQLEQQNRKLLNAKYKNETRSRSYEFAYGSNGLIKQITQIDSEGDFSYTRYFNFEHFNGGKQIIVNIDEGEKEEYEDNYSLKFILNDNGYIESCQQTYNDGEVDTWEFKYNEYGQMTKMIRSEGDDETWYLTYDNKNVIETGLTKDGFYDSITYETDLYNGNAVLHETLYGIDIDEMEIYGLLGMLGKPSKNFPSYRVEDYSDSNENYKYYFSWETDNHGYPVNLSTSTEYYGNLGDSSSWSFIWE